MTAVDFAARGLAIKVRDRQPSICIEWLGAVGDDSTDNSPILTQALAQLSAKHPNGFTLTSSGGQFRLGASVALPGNCRIQGVHFTNAGSEHFFTVQADILPADAFASFVENIAIEGCTFTCDVQDDASALYAVNVRNVRFQNNRMLRSGGVNVSHGADVSGVYDHATGGSSSVDPAVLAGFSATDPDYALSENITVTGNQLVGDGPVRMLARLNFVRKAVVANNIGFGAAISWWGGGYKYNEGGMPDMLRRVRDVSITGNYMEGGNGGIYGNNGEFMAITGNVVKNVTDTGIDLEGCKNSVVVGNTVQNAGNYCMSTFGVAFNVLFQGNVCIQDGTGDDISDQLYGGASSVGAQNGNILFGMVGGHSLLTAGVELRVIENTFAYTAPTGLGKISLAYSKRMAFEGNRFVNVMGKFENGTNFNCRANRNSFLFNQAPASAEDLITLTSGTYGEFCDNDIELDATMPAGSRLIYAWMGSASSSANFTIARNRVLHRSGSVDNDLVIEANPGSFTTKIAHIIATDNVLDDIVDLSEPCRARIFLSGNRTASHDPVPSIEGVPAQFNYAQNCVLETESPAVGGVARQIAIADGCTMAPGDEFQTAHAYAVDDHFWVDDGGTKRIYRVTAAGTSDAATPPGGTGTAIANGPDTLVVRYRGPVTVWASQSFDA